MNRMNKDTIYRQAAIDAMANTLWHYPNECYKNLNVYEFAKALAEMGLRSLPSAQPEQRWIPCSERLPKEDVEVLVTDDAGGMVTIDVDRCGRYEDTGERFWYTSQHVTAWMPLPECYQDKRKGADE